MDASPIPFSASDLERRRLETTLDHDLSSLSYTASTSFTSASSVSTIPVARSAQVARPRSPEYPRFPHEDNTPRAKRGAASYARTESSMGAAVSPTSTAGHHISAMTLGAGVFKRPGAGRDRNDRTGEEFDPDRSLGRLVGELAKAMGDDRIQKPVSPFVSPRSPRSPSPAPSTLPNLSFQLTRQEPPLSPPQSRTVSSASSGSQRMQSGATNNARANQAVRTPLGETGRHNRVSTKQSASVKDKTRFKNPTLVPVVVPSNTTTADITGITGLLATPAKGAQFDDLNKNGGDIGTAGANIPQALATLHARIRALETENGVSRRRIRELEAEVERAREEVVVAQQAHDQRLREVIGEKSALEDLVASLRENLKRLTHELEQNKALVSKLRLAADRPPSPIRHDSVRDELADLRKEVERLSREVNKLNHIAEAGLAERTKAREHRSVRINALDLHEQEEVDRVRADLDRRAASDSGALPSQLRQGLHAAAAAEPQLMPPSAAPPTRVGTPPSDHEGSPSPPARTRSLHSVDSPAHSITSHKSTSTTSSRRRRRKEVVGPDSPFPSIRDEDEAEFFSPRREPVPKHGLPKHQSQRTQPVKPAHSQSRPAHKSQTETVRAILTDGQVPPQTVVARVVRELEDDFAHYKQIYCELADQYKVLDAASIATKRHVLAENLKEVIDTLEQKADQIAALYSLLHFEDRPVEGDRPSHPRESARDLWRAVRESLPDDARRRLEADGLFRH